MVKIKALGRGIMMIQGRRSYHSCAHLSTAHASVIRRRASLYGSGLLAAASSSSSPSTIIGSVAAAATPPRRSVFTYPAPRKLTDIMKVPLVKKCDPIEIKAMWQEYHKERKDAFGETLPATQFNLLKERARASKVFLYPVFRESGYMMVISQFQDSCFLFTFLEDYRKNPQGATPWMCLTLYDEFISDKGIGLLRCDVGYQLTREEGTYLMQQLIEYYTHSDKFKTLWQFNHEAKNFSFEKYVRSVRTPVTPSPPLYKA